MITAIDLRPVETNWKGRPIGGCVSENVLFTPVRLLRAALLFDFRQSSPHERGMDGLTLLPCRCKHT